MERLAAHAHLHDASTSGPNSAPSTNWGNSATLPHPNSWLHTTQHHHNYQYHQVQQHSRSRSNSGHDVLLSSAGNWRCGPPLNPNDAVNVAPAAASYSAAPPPHAPYPPDNVYNPSQTALNTSFTSNANLNTSFGGLSTASLGSHNANIITAAHHHAVVAHHPAAGMEQKKEVKLDSMNWFHGKISRDEAEELLHPREDGLFLVRESTNFQGDYTLCVCFQMKVEHYRVTHKGAQLTIDEEEFFDDLPKLIEHYEQDADGLCTQLVRPLPKVATEEDGVRAVEAFKAAGWEINRKDLIIGVSIGKGEFGDVLLGEWRGKKVAVKRLKENCRAAQHLLDEASLMTSLKHENLVELQGLVFEGSSILLVTDYMSKGSLVDYLRSRGRLHVTKRNQIMFACDTAAGMAYLESKGVVHRDLAARNVLISSDDVAKVCDFGLAKTAEAKIDSVKFPIKWTAPEALRNKKFSNKSDMWSFGILLWEIYSFGRVPYPKIPLADVMKHVQRGNRMDSPDNCPHDVYLLMSIAWSADPEARLSFKEVHHRLLEIKSTTPA